jgi:hypothetical protein
MVLNNSTGTMHVQGTVKGRYTIGAVDSSSTSTGKVRIENDVKYQTDPTVNPSSTDMLGIVAYNDIVIADNHVSAGTSNFTVQASLFSYASYINVENYTTRPLGTLYTLGGWTVYDIEATTNSSITTGLSVNIRYDNRFRSTAPPFFPGTHMYEILAWYE